MILELWRPHLFLPYDMACRQYVSVLGCRIWNDLQQRPVLTEHWTFSTARRQLEGSAPVKVPQSGLTTLLHFKKNVLQPAYYLVTHFVVVVRYESTSTLITPLAKYKLRWRELNWRSKCWNYFSNKSYFLTPYFTVSISLQHSYLSKTLLLLSDEKVDYIVCHFADFLICR